MFSTVYKLIVYHKENSTIFMVAKEKDLSKLIDDIAKGQDKGTLDVICSSTDKSTLMSVARYLNSCFITVLECINSQLEVLANNSEALKEAMKHLLLGLLDATIKEEQEKQACACTEPCHDCCEDSGVAKEEKKTKKKAKKKAKKAKKK